MFYGCFAFRHIAKLDVELKDWVLRLSQMDPT